LTATGRVNPYASEEASKFVASQIKGARIEFLNDPGTGLFTLKPDVPAGVLLIEEFIGGLAPANMDFAASAQSPAGLSTRELEVLRLVAGGKSNAQIADELVISQNTVIRHVSNIFAKTGVANRAEAASYAHRNGIV
jgi:DNA-binding CsgD family transcriptional regulator